jgi:hypothetical protein
MFFAGLSAATLGAIAAAVGLLTIGLYILKLRRRPVRVPFSPIWQRVLKDKESTHLFSQLKRWLSLLLQLVMLGLIVLALGDPRLSEAWGEGRSIVALVDTSASMQATDGEPTRIATAKKKLAEIVDGLSSSDRLLIADMGPTPRPLSTMSGDIAELKKSIEELRSTETRADFERALRFARDSLRGLQNPEIIVLSDGALGDTERIGRTVDLTGIQLSYEPIGKDSKNIAITQFAVRRYPLDKSQYEVLLEVTNTNDAPAEVELTLLGDGEIVDVTTLKLGPLERLPRIYPDLAGASRTLEAKLRLKGETADALEADNHAYALMPERRRVKVLLVSAGNTYLQAALLLDKYLEVTPVAPEDPLPDSQFDVTILDGVAPPLKAKHGAALYLNPPAEGAPVGYAKDKPIEGFGFDSWEKKSPLLAFIAPENIQVSQGHALKPEEGDTVVGASELGPILVSGSREGKRFVALGFDPRNSDLVLRVAWPLFLLNTINTFAAEDVRYLSSFRTGEVWHIPAPSDLELAKLHTPSGVTQKVPVKNGFAVVFGESTGFYELIGKDGEVVHSFAANLSDLEESRLTPAPTLELGPVQAGAVSGFSKGSQQEIWMMLILAVMAMSLLEWFSYHRRLTV